MSCGKEVLDYTLGGREISRKCGGQGNWSIVLCDSCEKEANEAFPQGWDNYPGDICPHGVYIGGCGIDWMCHRCEMGDDE